MTKSRWFWPALVAAAGILGLQNGVWLYVTEPVLVWLRDATLNFITLGLDSYRDDIYKHAAKGPHEHAALRVLTLLISLIVCVPVALLAVSREMLRRLRQLLLRQSTETRNGTATPAAAEEKLFEDVLFERIVGDPRIDPRRTYRRFSLFVYGVVLMMFFWVGATAAGAAKLMFVSDAIAYYQQLRAVVAPHLTDRQILELDARFATIQGRADYLALMKDLDAEARKHTTAIPQFNVW